MVEEYLTHKGYFVRHNIKYLPNKDHPDFITNQDSNHSDIDVLAIDEKSEIIYSIECKNLNFGRNAREMANEIIRLYHGSDGEDSWILKHKKRNQWLKENFEDVINSSVDLIKKYYNQFTPESSVTELLGTDKI